MSPSKATELVPITSAKHDDSRCVICRPPDPRKRLREDQVWGVCPTNAPHDALADFMRRNPA